MARGGAHCRYRLRRSHRWTRSRRAMPHLASILPEIGRSRPGPVLSRLRNSKRGCVVLAPLAPPSNPPHQRRLRLGERAHWTRIRRDDHTFGKVGVEGRSLGLVLRGLSRVLLHAEISLTTRSLTFSRLTMDMSKRIKPEAVRAIGLAGGVLAWIAASTGIIGWPEAAIGGNASFMLALFAANRAPRGYRKSPGSRVLIRSTVSDALPGETIDAPQRYAYRCNIRGDGDPYPRLWRSSWIYIAAGSLVWRGEWNLTEHVLIGPFRVSRTPVSEQIDSSSGQPRHHQLRVEPRVGSPFEMAVPPADLRAVTSILQAVSEDFTEND
jgi:hypothetical protein